MFTIDTLEKFKAVWPYLSQDEKDEFVTAGPLRSVVHATNNQDVLGETYSGRAAVRRVYIFGPDDLHQNIVGEEFTWAIIDDIDPDHVYETIQLGVQIESRIQVALTVTNHGVFPEIKRPVKRAPQPTEPPVEAEPEPAAE